MPTSIEVTPANSTPMGYEQITGLTSAQSLTVPAGANIAILQAQDQDCRFRDDGTSPTASVGTVLEVKRLFGYSGDLSAVEIIETTATAIVNVLYYKGP